MNCKLCDTEMLPLYAYPHTVPEVIPFKACKKLILGYAWYDVKLYICPKCGSVFGEVNDDDEQ